MIPKIRYYVNDVCLRNLFYSFVQSHINYNLINWPSTYPTLINAIGLKVKAAVRLISFKNKYEHTNPLFLKHKILPLLDLIKYKKGIFLWKISKGYINEPLSIHTIHYVITCPTLNVHLISIKQSILALNTGTPFSGILEMHQQSIVLMKGTKSIYYPSQLLINCYHILLSSLSFYIFIFIFYFCSLLIVTVK